ncbi:thioredoxin domain-containing protein [Pseudolabrys taiwanensis]|uniref:Thioredoxin domain-containing protein n=1 Tax=Pseudolabrys taiwanensis TaxID=331696 RepID=A0A345ZZV8_9HYPH|nr:thioredoxin domain-containing protein [Pseudolabrys taiwanensis]AXK82455.1 thioredoxin domain-containing protein [Pseudolabrys taiwanensis]
MSAPQNTAHENRLAQATSPYLLQHKHNPVDWWQWGPEALAEAKRSNRPILLSVGYAACHWCHVMAHESFEDEATARVMNELFVNIKVDREERPDIDQIYMSALHMLGEQGGWPLTMFLTPAGEPVWGGTYFPKESRYGRAAFVDILHEVSRLFRDQPQKVEQNRAALLARLAQKARPEGKVVIGIEELDGAAKQIGNMFDSVLGGLRGAPKFPQPGLLEMLWRAGLRTGDARFFDTAEHSLERMSEGGIYDHLGGGFSRYSVDERWLVPHFEKMLYDNAQLLDLLALAYQRSHKELFATRARETVGWLKREMTTKEGAFCASLDADSEGEEGKFYVWSKNEVIELLGPDAGEFFAHHYDVTDDGNFEGHNILNRLQPVERGPAEEQRLSQLRDILLDARAARVRPGLDDKVLADWNGLMIAALVNAGIILEEPEWLDMAKRAFAFIAQSMTRGDRLGHSYRDGKVLFPGLASDFAAMIRAALALYEATGEKTYREQALTWQNAFDAHYSDNETGAYYLTADDATDLLLRPHSTSDDATPNPNAVAAGNLLRLAVLAGDDAFRARADRLFDHILAASARNLFGHVALLNALDLRLRAAEIVCVGSEAEHFAQLALRLPFLDRIVLRAAASTDLPAAHPAQDKLKALAGSAAFVCVAETCSLPVLEPAKIAETVEAMRERGA